MRFPLFTRYRRLKERIASLERMLRENRDLHQAQTAALQARLDSTMETLKALDVRVAEGRAALSRASERSLVIERLVTRTSAARPPGAARAVAQLPNPCVSIIMPTYNRAGFIVEAITSVLAQSLKTWELIIVDDGSTDGTEAAVAPFLADRRITYVRQEKANCSAARNRGIQESGAPFIAYLDSDNVWYPDFLACAVDCLATEPDVDLVYGALVTEHHNLGRSRILWEPFDREVLFSGNSIDTNVIVHRRTLVTRHGGWDPGIERLVDWDLVLRYTSEKPARALCALAAYYRVCDDWRVTDVIPFGPSHVAVMRKWFPPGGLTFRPRVLYAVWQYPQLSESYIEAELLCMRRWGVHIELWRYGKGTTPYPTAVPIHDGTLAEAIAAVRPYIIHVHWLSFGHGQHATLVEAKIPVTFRLHGFDVTRDGLAACLAQDWVKAIYAFPNQIAGCGLADARLKPTPAAFDSTLFMPRHDKDRRLVVRTSAALASKDLALFIEAAKRLPEYRFVLAVVTCSQREEYVTHLKTLRETTGSPVELLVDVPRETVAELVGRAGIYVHTLCPPGTENATPIGQPISIAEAMATGCHCLVRDLPEFRAYVGDAGATYGNLDELVGRIRDTEAWGDREWAAALKRSIDRAYMHHADVVVFREMFTDWLNLSSKTEVASTA